MTTPYASVCPVDEGRQSPPGVAAKDSPASETSETMWLGLVARLRAGDPAAMEELYRIISGGVRFYLWRHLGAQDLADRVHDVYLIVTEAIRAGELRDPARLMGYVRTVVRRQIAWHIHRRHEQRRRCSDLELGPPLADAHPNPERRVIAREFRDIAQRILRTLRAREREVLVRFYFEEQDAPSICREMQLTETQFRLLKSRAKARLCQLCRNRVAAAAPSKRSAA